MKPLSEILKADKETCEKATEGPWTVHLDDGLEPGELDVWGINHPNGRIVETDTGFYPPHRNDAELIARARTALPRYIEALEVALGALEKLKYIETEMGFEHGLVGHQKKQQVCWTINVAKTLERIQTILCGEG